ERHAERAASCAGEALRTVSRLPPVWANPSPAAPVAGSAPAAEGAAVPAEVEQAIQGERSAGSDLPEPVRSRMEWVFGTGLGSVRVHTGPRADFASRALGARAFATGRDVFFRQGEYAPERSRRERVLAHELA